MAKLTMNSPGGHAPRYADFSPPPRRAVPFWVWFLVGLLFLLMFSALIVTTTLLVVQSNQLTSERLIATQLNEPSYATVGTETVTRRDVNILAPEGISEASATPVSQADVSQAIATLVPAEPEPAPAAAETRVASVSSGPVRLGALHQYKVPNCVDYLDTLVKIANVRFAVGSDAPLDADMPRVRNIATAVETCDAVKVIVEGHSDRQGNPDLNMRLSWFRAQSIIDQLQKEGFDIAALQPRGFGAERPINLSGTISGEAENRRVQFALAPRAAAPAAVASDR